MKKTSFEMLTAPLFAAMGGACLFSGSTVIGVIAIAFAYGWSTGFFTSMFDNEAPAAPAEQLPQRTAKIYDYKQGA